MIWLSGRKVIMVVQHKDVAACTLKATAAGNAGQHRRVVVDTQLWN